MSRIVYRVQPEGFDWKLSRQDSVVDRFVLRCSALMVAREKARVEWLETRQQIQLVVHGYDGMVESDSPAGRS